MIILSSTTSHASTLFGDLDRNGNANAIVSAIDMARYGHDSTTTTTNGYDTMTMSSGAGDEQRGDVGNVLRLTSLGSGSGTQQDSSNSQILGLGGGLDSFDHDLNFDGDSLLDDGANQHNGLPSLPFTPSYDLSDAFSTTFEDPFSYPGLTTSFPSDTFTSSSYPHDHHHPNHPNRSSTENENEETNQHDLDNKMLGFGAPVMKAAILDSEGNQSWPTMSAELYGMFFVAEDVFGDQNGAGRPMELTCYRRNLFQISGTVTLSRSISHMLNEQNQRVPLFQLACTLSALESIEGKTTEIISVPWKTSAASGTSAVEDKSGASPPSWPLDLSMNPELDPASVSIPIAWKRLQFKHATANNGRRKGLQQHYVVQISLVGVLGNGERVTLAEMRSGPIIVRGRSPRNFDSRKDVALSERRVESRPRLGSDSNTAVSTPAARIDPAAHNAAFKFYALNALQTPLDLPDWTANSTPLPTDPPLTPRKKQQMLPSNSNTNPRPPVPKTKWKTEIDHKPVHKTSPIDLSLTEDSSYSTHSGKGGPGGLGLGAPSSPLMNRKLVSSPVESADLLYEYFPLSLDDWMPPVDAIYRPHVVHHTIVPPDLKASMVKNKTKRYFSAED